MPNVMSLNELLFVVIDFSGLWPEQERRKAHADVLNGISISKDDDILYITGKKWNRMYKLKLLGF